MCQSYNEWKIRNDRIKELETESLPQESKFKYFENLLRKNKERSTKCFVESKSTSKNIKIVNQKFIVRESQT